MPATFVALWFAFRASAIQIWAKPPIIGLDRSIGGTLQCSYAATGEFPNCPGLLIQARLANFLDVYCPLADRWAMYENSGAEPKLEERGP
jgi:hypothetical protein